MFTQERQKLIVDIIKKKGRVRVNDLVKELGVTAQTIRSDLKHLNKNNMILRVHGGAQMHDGKTNMTYETRRQIASKQKIVIGKLAASKIPNNASLFINIGTTTEAFSDALLNHKGLMVITNNINVASKLRLGVENEIIIAAGTVRASDGGVVGEAAVDFIKNFKVDYAIIGSSAIDVDGGLLDFDFREVKVARAIIENARHVILIADSTKQKRNAPVRIGHISQVDTFITDKIINKKLSKICKKENIELIIAS